MIIENLKAVIPTMQGAIRVGGGKQNSTRLHLDIYASPQQVATLMQMQDTEIVMSLTTEDGPINADGLLEPGGVA